MKIEVIKPFGPTIVKLKIPNDIVNEMNNYADDIINNEKKSEELNEGPRLAGNVSQEFLLDMEFMKKSIGQIFQEKYVLDGLKMKMEEI